MTPDEFIEQSIDRGLRFGLEATSGLERTVFLIADAQTLCDMEGIAWFVDYLEPSVVRQMSSAFEAIGCSEISKVLSEIATEGKDVSDEVLTSTWRLITDRVGCGYEEIRDWVARELEGRP